jgi:O-antigen/teichoic acid export membrane protein
MVVAFAAVHLFTYPWISISTALLERSLSYSKLAWIESVGVAVERGSPAILLLVTNLGLASFVYGLILGRIIRMVWLQMSAPVWPVASRHTLLAARHMFAQGAWYQIGQGSSSVRDNLHVLLVGPLSGTSWVGYYAWAMQVCTIASQLFVQISARISLSLMARVTDHMERWTIITQQARTLAATTAPVLAAVMIAAPIANYWLFAQKWSAALPLLALLCLRMLPGIASTSLSPYLLIMRGTKQFAAAGWRWTAVEVILGLGAITAFGSIGLAYSYSVTAWIGIALIIWALRGARLARFIGLVEAIVGRPAVWISLIFGSAGFLLRQNSMFLTHLYLPIAMIGLMGIVASIADKELRVLILPGYARRLRSGPGSS